MITISAASAFLALCFTQGQGTTIAPTTPDNPKLKLLVFKKVDPKIPKDIWSKGMPAFEKATQDTEMMLYAEGSSAILVHKSFTWNSWDKLIAFFDALISSKDGLNTSSLEQEDIENLSTMFSGSMPKNMIANLLRSATSVKLNSACMVEAEKGKEKTSMVIVAGAPALVPSSTDPPKARSSEPAKTPVAKTDVTGAWQFEFQPAATVSDRVEGLQLMDKFMRGLIKTGPEDYKAQLSDWYKNAFKRDSEFYAGWDPQKSTRLGDIGGIARQYIDAKLRGKNSNVAVNASEWQVFPQRVFCMLSIEINGKYGTERYNIGLGDQVKP